MKRSETLAAPLLALGLYALLHVVGIGMTVDGWAAWQGGVSLATGNGYTYLSGDPVLAWPPLYSLYLAPWIFLAGPFGWSLTLANAVLIAAQAFCWYRLTRMMCTDSGLRIDALTSYALSLFLALYLNALQWQVLGHNLAYVVLPLFLGSVWRLVSPTKPPRALADLALAIGLGTVLMLSHNSCVAFVGAAAFMVAVRKPVATINFVQAILLAVIPLGIWKLVRDALGQTGSHPIGLGNGKYGFLEYLVQLVQGPGQLMVPDRFFAPFIVVLFFAIVVALSLGNKKAAALRFGTTFSLCSLAILFAMFNLTWIVNDLSSSRFILYVPLLVLLPLFVLTRERAPKAAAVVALLFLVPQVYWVANWGLRQIRETLAEQGFPESFAMPNVYVSRTYLEGPPITTDRGILISPFAFNDPAGRRTSDKEVK